MAEKTYFHFWFMFSAPALEQWLSSMARQGWILQRVKHHYWFTFREGEPKNMVYRIDYKGYMPAGYLAELGRENWLVQSIDRNWQVCYKPYQGEMPYLSSSYDEDIVRAISRNSVIILVVAIMICVAFWFFINSFPSNQLLKAVLLIAIASIIYNILRLSFAKAMLQERIEHHK